MKKITLVLSLLTLSLTTTKTTATVISIANSNFNDGWADGYCYGWREVKGKYAYCPYPPYPPYPAYGKDKYQDAYILGYKRGVRDAE